MIIKASQRGGAKQLAAHLSRTDENEHVELIELRHFVSDHMAGAFAETHGISLGTRCKQPLEKDSRAFSLDEWQAAKRLGFHAGDLKESIRDSWAISDSSAAFTQGLNARGLTLAKGDRRGHVIVSHAGEVFSLARMIGRPARDVRARLGEPTALPDVAEAKAQFAGDMAQAAKRVLREAGERKAREIAPLDAERGSMVQRQREERRRIEAAQRDRWVGESRARASRFKTGLIAGLWQRVTGQHANIRKQNEAEAYAALQRDQRQRQVLFDAQLGERQVPQIKIQDVRKRHAGLFREIRQDRDQYRQAERMALSEAKSQFERAGADTRHAPRSGKSRTGLPRCFSERPHSSSACVQIPRNGESRFERECCVKI